jgi:hypothetical protein
MQSGGDLGIKKEGWGNLSKEDYFGGKIAHRNEALFVSFRLGTAESHTKGETNEPYQKTEASWLNSWSPHYT